MIPDHLIDQAAAAIYATSVFGDKFAIDAWHDMNEDHPVKAGTRELATAALEAIAAHIWDEGWAQGTAYLAGMERGADDNDLDHALTNPYKASEDA
ncbi:hypothetical protein HMPREF3159_03490 [Brachybacterium sp. HMSC06H03]|uniref:hypothetical protein n=1 Tax=Brachybacterium sp. HMSC06H03 TaxID=1581127 RepID=UPI0008A3C8EA|nr:hypothetical protein [Brachybacterium sp. HMSC06H03]OFT62588.1 hypothetical protein HMPREF3159_03490 [Brachybacterium sp. HMSC06H03]